MFVQEDVFRDQVTSELVDQCGLIKPLAPLIFDFAFPTWTWDLDSDDAREIAVPDATGQTITTQSPQQGSRVFGGWIKLATSQNLRPGDCLKFMVTIPKTTQTKNCLVGVAGPPKQDMVGCAWVEIQHSLSELRGIVFSRNTQEVRIRTIFGSERQSKEQTLTQVNSDVVLHPAIHLWMFGEVVLVTGETLEAACRRMDLSFSPTRLLNPINWTITLSNHIESL